MFSSLEQAVEYLESFIPTKPNLNGPNSLKRVLKVLTELDNPQSKYKVIHIAGTSGKTSISILTSHLLQSQGFRVGLTYSPYISSILEESQINNQNLESNRFIDCLNQIQSVLESNREGLYGSLTYMEALSCLIAYIFAAEKIKVAVVETRVGGLYDMMTAFNPIGKICVIGDIGLDHKHILGNTLPEIAYQKAGIIQPYNDVVSIKQSDEINDVFHRVATENLATEYMLEPNLNYSNIHINNSNTSFDYSFDNLKLQIELKTKGLFQVKNTALSLTAVVLFVKSCNKIFDTRLALVTLKEIQIPARFSVVNINDRTIVLDGAHNIQKMTAFVQSFQTYYPNKKATVLLSFKEGKEYIQILEIISQIAGRVVFTEFNVSKKFNFKPVNSSELHKYWSEKYSHIPSNYIGHIDNQKFMSLINTSDQNQYLVISGSLYLAGQIYPWLSSLDKS
jgi:dihydrofolate synthase / folylpolyglutamate synthase